MKPKFGGWAVIRWNDDEFKIVSVGDTPKDAVLARRLIADTGETDPTYRLLGDGEHSGNATYDIVPISKLAYEAAEQTTRQFLTGPDINEWTLSFLYGGVTLFEEHPTKLLTVDEEMKFYKDLIDEIPLEGDWIDETPLEGDWPQ